MSSLIDSDIQRFVACLVLGYLENQQLQNTYKSFCETSRHLLKEKKGLKYGNKPLDTSVGLVNIIREYFSIKARINEFLRMSPHSPIVIELIETEDTKLRLDIILKAFKESLKKTDSVPVESVKKRKHEIHDVFDVSQTNTSTPETNNPSKRRRKSLTTPFLTISANKENKSKSIEKNSTSRHELRYSSSSDTSEKENEDEEKEEDQSPSPSSADSSVNTLKPEQQLSETLLKKPEFAEQFADLINKTLLARETESTLSVEGAQEILITHDDIDNILSGTQKEMAFDDIVNDLVKDLYPLNQELELPGPSHHHGPFPSSSLREEIPIKQRLRPRSEKKPSTNEQKKKIEKVTILSDEPYTGIVPSVANMTRFPLIQPGIAQNCKIPPFIVTLPAFMQNGLEMIPVMQTEQVSSVVVTSSSSVPAPLNDLPSTTSSSIIQTIVPQSQNLVPTTLTPNIKVEADMKQTTPKITLFPNFLNSKCKSTPRRKATHVRILDFSHTPSHQRLGTVREFTTPSNGISTSTPGSAPATINMFRSSNREVVSANNETVVKVPDVEENSNSNSISNTPKVAKNPRRRKIGNIKQEKKVKTNEEPKSIEKELVKPCTSEEWKEMRLKSKTIPIDQQVRSVFQKAVVHDNTKKRRKVKKPLTSKQVALKNKFSSKSPAKLIGKIKSPVKKATKDKKKSPSEEIDENKPLSLIKLKILSPRKKAAEVLKKSPKGKKKSIVQISKDKFEKQEKLKAKKKVKEPEPVISELNRSDTVQEVATVLTQLSDTILAEVQTVKTPEADDVNKSNVDSGIDQNILLETPFKDLPGLSDETPLKDQTHTPLPNTPRFAIPLISSVHETPVPKVFASTDALVSLVKNCDILTPSFPITPGFKESTSKDVLDGSPASGYSNRRTDYSSCSSYYKPDESEDIEINFNSIINQRKIARSEKNSQSESDGGVPQVLRSVKKVECPGAIERVKSFSEEQNKLVTPHYEMMEEGLLSESMITTATDDSSDNSSSFTCSTCSTTDDTDDENTMDKLEKLGTEVTDEKDSEWDCEDQEIVTKAVASTQNVMNDKTGEVRFPLRNWITPKKLEVDQEQLKIDETNKIKLLLNENDPRRGISVQEEHEKRMKHMEEVKQRTLLKIRNESGKCKFPEQKFKKANIKSFKMPAVEVLKPPITSRKEQILQQNLTDRPRPIPLTLSSSTRRKNPTPRKTITINELPRQPSPKKKKKSETPKKSPKKPTERISLESVSDNAIMPEDSTSLEMSSSFNTSNEEETASTVIVNKIEVLPVVIEEGSNTFQRSMIAQGFDKTEAKELQSELVDKLEVPTVENSIEKSAAESAQSNKSEIENEDSSSEEEDDDELEFCSAETNETNTFNFVESEDLKSSATLLEAPKIPNMILNYPDQRIVLVRSKVIDLFSIEPVKPKKALKKELKSATQASESKNSNGKDHQSKQSTKKTNLRWDQSKTLQADQSNEQETQKPKLKINIKEKNSALLITEILDKLHGSKSS